MKSFSIKITDIDLSGKNMLDAKSYPGPGFYSVLGSLYFVGSISVYSMGCFSPEAVTHITSIENLPTPTPVSNGGVSEETLLKALAIAQTPSLAVELFKLKGNA